LKVDMVMTNEPTSRDAIARLERELGVAFPGQYVEFLLDQNGGLPRAGVFPYDDNESSVSFFGAYTGQDYNDVAEAARRHAGRLPSEFIPVGDDPGGNLVVLAVSGADIGSIWFWDHENESAEGVPSRDNMYKLAATLSEFVASLTLDPSADWA